MTKKCTVCHKIKDETEFYRRGEGGKRTSQCKTCDIKRFKQWAKDNPEKYIANVRHQHEKRRNQLGYRQAIRKRNLARAYDITPEQYNVMSVAQNGLCAICGLPETAMKKGKLLSLAVDHDRETGKVRALLCCNCNRALGGFKHSPECLEKAAAYLRSFLDSGDQTKHSIQDIFSPGVSG